MGQFRAANSAFVCIAIIALLLIVPATRSSTWAIIRATTLTLPTRTPRRLAACAKAHPGEYIVQLGYALDPTGANEGNLEARGDPTLMAALETRFPANPSAFANCIVETLPTHLLGFRPEWQLESTDPSRFCPPAPPAPVLANLDAQCASGERLDPGNAYFPAMRMAVLLAQNRDIEAQAELGRAAACSRWSDYSGDQSRARWRMSELISGFDPPFHRLSQSLHDKFGRQDAIREASDIVAIKAWQLDKKGCPEQAIAIRYALMRMGSIQRAYAQTYIGSLCGAAIEGRARGRLSGPKKPIRLARRTTESELRANYYGYLSSHDHAVDIGAAKEQFDEIDAVKKLEKSAGLGSRSWFTRNLMEPVLIMMLTWGTWFGALLAIVFHISMSLSSRIPAYWRREAATTPRVVGLLSGIAAGTALVAGSLTPSTSLGEACIGLGGAVTVASLIGASYRVKEDIREWANGALIASISVYIVLSMMTAYLCAGSGYIDTFFGSYGTAAPAAEVQKYVANMGAVILLMPLIWIAPIKRKQVKPAKDWRPASYRQIVLHVAAFAAAQIAMAVIDAPAIAALNATVTGEGPYLARQAHKTWPTTLFDPPSHAWKEIAH